MSSIPLDHSTAANSKPASTLSGNENNVLSEKEVAIAENPIAAKEAPPHAHDAPSQYIHGTPLILVMTALMLFVFLVALDQTIVSTAIPIITNQFNAFSDVGWYGSAYLLTSTAFQPLFGRMYQSFDIKLVYMISLFIFEVGSLITAVAVDSPMFIVGRAIAGLGLAGGYSGSMIIVSIIAPTHQRPLLQSLLGAAYGGGAAVGPIIGGAFTSNATWRWCFYINLIFYAIVGPAILLILKLPKVQHPTTVWKRLAAIDWLGSILVLCSLICILLVFQWGGLKYQWGDSKIIGLIVGFVVIGAVFVVEQYYMGDRATIPFKFFKQRTVGFGALVNFGIAAAYFTELYFLPIYFQAVRGSSAIRSGVQVLPFIFAVIFFVTFVGGVMNNTGIYIPILIAGTACLGLSGGVLYFLEPDSSQAMWAGLEFFAGSAPGAIWMICFSASSAVLPPEDIALGSAIVIFAQTLGGTIFVSVAQSVFQNKFIIYLRQLPGVDAEAIVSKGVTTFRAFTPADQLPLVVDAANRALQRDWIMVGVLGAFAFVCTFGMELGRRIPKELVDAPAVAAA